MSTIDDVLASRIPFAVKCSRAEDFAARLPDGCASMLWCDIPYHRAIDAAWDNRWATDDAFLAWVGGLCEGWKRILAPNGSLYVFASPKMAWAVEGVVREHFEVLTNIRWKKPDHSTKAEMFVKEDLRSPFPASETILFCEQVAKSIGEVVRAARINAGLSTNALEVAIGFVESKHPERGSRLVYRWESHDCCPTREQYDKTMVACGVPAPASYESLARPFQATPERPYTDVWTYPTVPHYEGKHPCEKPYPMCEDAVLLSTRPGDLVVDLFCGAGGIGSAAVANGRRFIGGDMDKHWADFTRRRCDMTKATGQTTVRKIHKPNGRMPSLALMLEQETE